MHVVVKSITDLKIPQPSHGKNLARLAHECFTNQQVLTLDFKDLETISPGFFQELFLPLLAEQGAENLKALLKIVNASQGLHDLIQAALSDLNGYFDQRLQIHNKDCDPEIYEMNLAWLIKARELARANSVLTELVMGIADDELCQVLKGLTMDDIQHIAQSGWLSFSPRFSSEFIKSLVANPNEPVNVLLGLSGAL